MEKKEPGKPTDLIIPVVVAFFNVLIVLFPTDILQAAREGLSLWFNNVAPSLLPFIIGTNVLTGLGFVSFAGVLLEPVMAPLFGVPGCGGYALATGMTSGYPIGAKTVALLREKKELDRTQAQRLIAFCNNSGPLFMLGAVGVGMFGSARAGVFIMICHYASSVLTGVVFRFYKYGGAKKNTRRDHLFSRALRAMRAARQKDGRGFSMILGDSVKSAMETITMVGGFIILFCVIVKMLEVTEALTVAERGLSPLTRLAGLDGGLPRGLLVGFIEATNGCNILAQSAFSKAQMLSAVAVVSFGGLSVFAQTVSIINKTDINKAVYFCSKLLHAGISVVVAGAAFPFFTFAPKAGQAAPVYLAQQNQAFQRLAYSSMMFAFSTAFIIAAAAVICLLNGARYFGRGRKRV